MAGVHHNGVGDAHGLMRNDIIVHTTKGGRLISNVREWFDRKQGDPHRPFRFEVVRVATVQTKNVDVAEEPLAVDPTTHSGDGSASRRQESDSTVLARSDSSKSIHYKPTSPLAASKDQAANHDENQQVAAGSTEPERNGVSCNELVISPLQHSGSSHNMPAVTQTDQKANSQVYPIGTEVQKKFFNDHGKQRLYVGKVTKYDAAEDLYIIVYEDDDWEELQTKDITKLLMKQFRTKKIGPLLVGTLSLSEKDGKACRIIRGDWTSDENPYQPFELSCKEMGIDAGEDSSLPRDGQFNGSFIYEYHVAATKSKIKEVVKETEVNIKFDQKDGDPSSFSVTGQGVNRFGTFELKGKATIRCGGENGVYDIQLHKRYRSLTYATNELEAAEDGSSDDGKLPPPSKLYPHGRISLRGKMSSDNIQGQWSTGLDTLIANSNRDQSNLNHATLGGLCNDFEYQFKGETTESTTTSPPSGAFSGWFYIDADGDNKTKIEEQRLTLTFRENSEGYHNVYGKGSNCFGTYKIAGTLTNDGVITMFRHFYQPNDAK